MSDIKKQVEEAYEQMPNNSKKRAADIHGVSFAYFRRLVYGEGKDLSVYYSAFNAIKQAAGEALREVQDKVDAINSIKVSKPSNKKIA